MKKIMINHNRFRAKKGWYLWMSFFAMIAFTACKKQLDVKNPNIATFEVNVTDVGGLIKYSKGGVYWNGFNYLDGWLGDSYFSLPWCYHEEMGDVVGGGQGSNNQTTTMGVPEKFIADPSNPGTTTFTNPTPQVTIIRSFNTTAASANANNALYYEWANMYSLNNVCNKILSTIGTISMTADQANTFKAWAYWWKGFAYAQIGTLYVAGLINDGYNSTNGNYVDHNAVIAESNKQLNNALSALSAISSTADYNSVINTLIPAQCQVGRGLPPTVAMWKRSINTMLARNILLNRLEPFVNGNLSASITKASMPVISNAELQSVITYCNNGLQAGDYVFTGRSSSANSFFTAQGGSVASLCAQSNQASTLKVGERLVQQFKANDNRRANFTVANGTFYGDANTNSTRWSLKDGVTAGLSGIPILGSRQPGGIEVYMGPTYEENQLMLAEAQIRSGNINTGLASVDAVRSFQGAGVANVSGTGLTQVQAMNEVTMERIAGLAFRGLSYYDLRRWGWTYSIANGGGRYGCNVIFNGNLYTNATFSYNYMDFWDVLADELTYNPPAAGSVSVTNTNF
jgi:starch-binding outer membrane protein, SusD/RagB family